jgi:hypothetical protein
MSFLHHHARSKRQGPNKFSTGVYYLWLLVLATLIMNSYSK